MSTHPEFHAETLEGLLESATERVSEDGRNNFRAIALSSNLDIEEVVEKFSTDFEVESQGDFFHLSDSYSKYRRKIEVHLYLYQHEDTKTPIIFTLNSSEEFRRTAKPIILGSEGLYYLWIPPHDMDAISDEILEFEGARLTRFIGEKFGQEARSQQVRRPEMYRREEYSGEDSAQTLEEAKVDYGITPTKLEFEIPTEASFTISNEGEVVMNRGDARFFFQDIVVNMAVEKVEEMNNQVQSSKLEVIEEDGIEVFDKKSLEIKLNNSIEYDHKEDLIQGLKEDDFYPYNISAEQGSLLLTGRIVDEENGGMFSLTTDGSQLSLLPKHGSSFDAIMRFYRFVVENFDPSAHVIET